MLAVGWFWRCRSCICARRHPLYGKKARGASPIAPGRRRVCRLALHRRCGFGCGLDGGFGIAESGRPCLFLQLVRDCAASRRSRSGGKALTWGGRYFRPLAYCGAFRPVGGKRPYCGCAVLPTVDGTASAVRAVSENGRGLLSVKKTSVGRRTENARAKRFRFARAVFSAFDCSAQSAEKLSLSCGQQRRCRRER